MDPQFHIFDGKSGEFVSSIMNVLHLTIYALLCFAIITSINGLDQYLYDMRSD